MLSCSVLFGSQATVEVPQLTLVCPQLWWLCLLLGWFWWIRNGNGNNYHLRINIDHMYDVCVKESWVRFNIITSHHSLMGFSFPYPASPAPVPVQNMNYNEISFNSSHFNSVNHPRQSQVWVLFTLPPLHLNCEAIIHIECFIWNHVFIHISINCHVSIFVSFWFLEHYT